MGKDKVHKLSKTTVFLHWVVGVFIIALLASGFYMTEFDVGSLYSWHKSFGVIAAIFVLYRVFWRIINGWPPPAGKSSNIEKLFARLVHYVLILSTVLMPLSGILYSSMKGYGLSVFGFMVIPKNTDPAMGGIVPINATIAEFSEGIHEVFAWVIVVSLCFHIAGGMKSHFIRKDGTLKRIFGAEI